MKKTHRMGLASVVLLGAAVMVATVSCGSSNDANTARRAYTLDNVCELMAQEICPLVKPCCESSGLVYFPKGCEAEELEGCGEQVARVKAGRATFDAQAADACMTKGASFIQKCQLETQEELLEHAEWDALCRTVFKGTRAEGESCQSDLDCIPPSDTSKRAHCRSEQCVHETAFVGEGEVCDQSELTYCKEGLYCRTKSYLQPPGVCEKVRAVGEHCDFPTQCEAGAHCDALGSVCVAKKAVGEACSSSDECGVYWCIDGTCAGLPMVDDATCNGGWGAEDPGPPKLPKPDLNP